MHVGGRSTERRRFVLVGAALLVGSMFYSALTPLLPVYVERFDLSKAGAGVLTGAFAAGILLGAFPSAGLVVRLGAWRTLLIGLALQSLACIVFAFGSTIIVLDASRLLLGVGGACAWAGGMGTLVASAAPEKRGSTIGGAMSAVVVGYVLGPVLGAIARATGPELSFAAIGVACAALAVAIALSLEPPARGRTCRRPSARPFGDARIRIAVMIRVVLAMTFGALDVLVPVQFDVLGASGFAIGGAFVAAAVLEGFAQPLIGRATDRWGRIAPIRPALAGLLVSLVLFPLSRAVWLLAVVLVFAWAVGGAANTPAMTLLADGVEGAGLDQGLGFALNSFVGAGGQVVGAVAGGALAAQASDAAVYLLLAALCALTLAVLHPVRSGIPVINTRKVAS